MTISERIFDLLDKRGLTQKELSDYTGIKVNTISNWKTKHTNPSSDKIIRISEFFQVSVEWLLTGVGEINRRNTQNESDEYEFVIVSSEQDELWQYYSKLDKIEQAKILERIKTIVEIKENSSKRDITNSKKGKRNTNIKDDLKHEANIS